MSKSSDFNIPTTSNLSTELQLLVSEGSARIKRREKGTSKSRGVSDSIFSKVKENTAYMIQSGDWDQCTPIHLVALYSIMHEKCYGIKAGEIELPKERYKSEMMVKAVIEREFNNIIDAVEYFRWAWTKELSSERWRRENDRVSSWRLTLGYMLGAKAITDYRLFLSRQRFSRGGSTY